MRTIRTFSLAMMAVQCALRRMVWAPHMAQGRVKHAFTCHSADFNAIPSSCWANPLYDLYTLNPNIWFICKFYFWGAGLLLMLFSFGDGLIHANRKSQLVQLLGEHGWNEHPWMPMVKYTLRDQSFVRPNMKRSKMLFFLSFWWA